MKQVFKIAPLALAVAAFSFTGTVVAEGYGGHRGGDGATIKKYVKVSKDVEYKGKVRVTGTIRVNSLGMAVIDDEQDSDDNRVINNQSDNNALIGNNALRGAKGNIGLNMSAGDNNVQGNSAALAAADAAFIFGSADAEIFVDQNADNNFTRSIGSTNNAVMGHNAMRNARGNIGVNITAGSGNVQKNAFAGAVASGSMGEATVQARQETENNTTHNNAQETYEVLTTRFTVGGRLNGSYAGGGRGSYDTVGATYNGESTQDGAVYPEVWMDDGDHANGDNAIRWGHLDFDDENGDGTGDQKGTFDFDENGTITPNEDRGDLRFREAGLQTLAGVMRGSAQHVVTRYIRHANNAVLSDNALRGARGNIGVNVSAGTNNLQNNSLAISRVNAPAATGGGEGGGGE